MNYKFILLFCYFNIYGLECQLTLHSPCKAQINGKYNTYYSHCVLNRDCCIMDYHDGKYFFSAIFILQIGNCTKGRFCCPGQVSCQDCEDGYRKVNDTCIDINECVEEYGVCSGHNCSNTIGSYECECYNEFELLGTLKTCKHINETEMSDFLVSDSRSINLIPFNTTNATLIESNIKMLYSGTVFPKSIDFSFNGNYMAWTDSFLRQITITPLNYNNPSSIINIIVLRYFINPNKLSIDWIHDLIYWTDRDSGSIKVIHIHSPEDRYTLINTTDYDPRDFLVNVLDNCLIWTHIYTKSRIMRSNQDGTQIVPLYTSFKHPFYLTIDTTLKRYFFIDIEDSTLYSIDFKGNDERKHFQTNKLVNDIRSALIYGDNIYLLQDSFFYSINKFGRILNESTTIWSERNGRANEVLIGSFKNKQIFDFKILDPILQPQLENKCQFAKCSHLCLPSDKIQLFRCFCPEKYFLVNKTVCIHKYSPNFLLNSMERDSEDLINQSMSNRNDLRKLFDKSLGEQITNNCLEDQRGNRLQVILILILIAITVNFPSYVWADARERCT